MELEYLVQTLIASFYLYKLLSLRSQVFSVQYKFVGGGYWCDVTPSWSSNLTWEIRGSSPPPCLWNARSAYWSHWGRCFQGCSLERVKCCWDHLDGIFDWIQIRPLYTQLRFWQVVGSPSSLVDAQDNPYLLNSLAY